MEDVRPLHSSLWTVILISPKHIRIYPCNAFLETFQEHKNDMCQCFFLDCPKPQNLNSSKHSIFGLS